jgi:3-oxoacyl-[acyl-carrier protein] reductase
MRKFLSTHLSRFLKRGFMNNALKGQVALVTGASRGIGQAIAIALAEEGCHVALLARTESALENTARQCSRFGVKTLILPYDLTELDRLKEPVERTVGELGDLQILVNSAGIVGGGDANTVDTAVWNEVIQVNLQALMYLTKFALPQMEKSGRGAIINIASVSSRMYYPSASAYVAAKHGVLGFSGSVFEEVLGKNIKICTISPGLVNTEMVAHTEYDKEMMIQPKDVAQTVLFVLKFPEPGCPTEITIRSRHSPF